jgi:hydrogenase/urease accessory protein HupE
MTRYVVPPSGGTWCAGIPAKAGTTCLLFLFLTISAFAHDPGLSHVTLEQKSNALYVTATFSDSEVASLDLRRAIEISINGTPVKPASFATQEESSAIRVSYLFPLTARGSVDIQSPLLEKLAPGHRQYVTFAGKSLVLTAQKNSTSLEVSGGTFVPLLRMGVEHIWFGFDHLAFLLALLLAVANLREAFKIITAFTIAHSITLTAATFDLLRLPGNFVEPVIALSIVYVGIENFFGKPRTNRALVTFAFGLIHGFGFATALKELGIGRDAPTALLAFNLGVELGQVTIAAVLLQVLWKLRDVRETRYVQVCSVIIAAAGGWWLFERIILA